MAKKARGIHFLLLASAAFGGLGLEVLLAYLIEPAIYGKPLGEWTTAQTLIHWSATCIVWGIAVFALLTISKRKLQFDLFGQKGKMRLWQWAAVAASLVFTLVISYIDWNGLKIVKEFQYNGWLKFTFQYVYYMVETLLFMLIIVFGQRAFELWFGKENFPFGGIAVALTWGIVHIISRGFFDLSNGLLSVLSGFIYGVIYLLVNKDIRKTYIFLFISFIL